MKNKIEDLRDHLFETLEALKDDENPMDVSRAKAIADVSGRIIDSAKVENEYLSITGATAGSSGFIPEEPRRPGLMRQTHQIGSDQ